MKPTATWQCDQCRGVIGKPAHGIVEWLRVPAENGRWRNHALRLVHRCKTGPRAADRCDRHYYAAIRREEVVLRAEPLTGLLGHDGRARLESLHPPGETPAGELREMLHRLHTPGYEHARPHIDRAIALGALHPSLPLGHYTQAELRAVLEFAKAAP